MKKGCNRDICINKFCKNNPNIIVPASDKDILENAINLWRDHYENKKYQYWEIVCDSQYMRDMCKTLQHHNLMEIKHHHYMVEFVNSPYAFCLSFLQDPSIIGKEDPFG